MTLYMDAVVTPHRSLSRRGFYWLIGVLVAFNLVIAAFLIALKAFPVPIFLGIDVIGVLLAFRTNYRGARQTERLQVSAEQVKVLYQFKGRARTVWASPTAFTQVSVESEGEHEARVSLKMSGRAVIVGAALSPGEREDLAVALRAAIRDARAERHSPLAIE
jgi:uncharacterized membrane protein